MELPRGITGFHDGDEPPPPACDIRAFRGLCHAGSRALGGRVVGTGGPVGSGVANFTGLTLDLPGGRVAVLINLHHPIVAFAEAGEFDEGRIRFIDAPALARHLDAGGGYLVLAAQEAASPVGEASCRLLARAELTQVRYWRPRCIGEVAFNRWD